MQATKFDYEHDYEHETEQRYEEGSAQWGTRRSSSSLQLAFELELSRVATVLEIVIDTPRRRGRNVPAGNKTALREPFASSPRLSGYGAKFDYEHDHEHEKPHESRRAQISSPAAARVIFWLIRSVWGKIRPNPGHSSTKRPGEPMML